MARYQERSFTAEEITAIVSGVLKGHASSPVCGLVTDSREVRQGNLFLALHGEYQDAHQFIPAAIENGAAAVIADREVSVPEGVALITVPNTLYALAALAKEHKSHVKAPTAVITGSVGKTTTRSLVAAVVREQYRTLATEGNFNNEIGMPQTLFGLNGEEERIVLEAGMNNAGEMHRLSLLAEPDLAIITCIGTAHIGNLGSRAGIRDAKMEVTDGMRPGSVLLIPDNEPLLAEKRAAAEARGIRVLTVGEGKDADFRILEIRESADCVQFDLSEAASGEICRGLTVFQPGHHIAFDAAFAYAAARLWEIGPERIRKGLAAYEPVGMRQKITDADGITIIADCYNASPESMKASLAVLRKRADSSGGRAIAVLGDMLELGDMSTRLHEEVGAAAACADLCFLIGTEAPAMKRGAVAAGMDPSAVFGFDAAQEPAAVAHALLQTVRQGDTVLFKASRGMRFERILRAFEDARQNKENGTK